MPYTIEQAEKLLKDTDTFFRRKQIHGSSDGVLPMKFCNPGETSFYYNSSLEVVFLPPEHVTSDGQNRVCVFKNKKEDGDLSAGLSKFLNNTLVRA